MNYNSWQEAFTDLQKTGKIEVNGYQVNNIFTECMKNYIEIKIKRAGEIKYQITVIK